MNAAVEYEPVAVVTFTPEEVELIETLAARHYDAECRAAVAPGGFLYRCGMFRDCVLSFRQVDTLAKTLEMSPLVVGPLWDLRVGTRRVLREMRTAPPNKTIDFDSEGQ